MGLVYKRSDQKKNQSADFPFHRLFAREAEQSASSDTENISTKYMRTSSDISSHKEEVASTSGIYSEVLGEEFVGYNGSLLSLQPWIFKKAKCSKRAEENFDSSSRWSFDWSGFSWTSHGSPDRINPVSHSISSKKRRQYGCNFRPVTFSEKFFLPHICSENVGIEEYTFNFDPSPSTKDERLSCLSRRIDPRRREANRMRVDSYVEQPENESDTEFCSIISSEKVSIDQIGDSVTGTLRSVIGVPYLPLQKPRKAERKSREAIPGSLDASFSRRLCKISDPIDSLDKMFLLLLGVTIGVTSNVLSHRIEVEDLKKLLKDNNNLVQDLHERLEMKDSFLKELANGADGNEELEHNLTIKPLQYQNLKLHATALKMDDCDNSFITKVGEDLSKIEAELEAELEKLELNINASSIEQTTSDPMELDSELVAEVVSGELREDLLVKCVTDDDKATTTASTTQPYNTNYSVSPKELSLRLHKVIESRLEERIKELETALEETQMKLKLVEAERLSPIKPPFSSSDTASSNRDSPKASKRENSSLRLDLSGEALVAYDEVYDEFMRLADTGDDKLPSHLSSGDKSVLKDGQKEQACEQIMWRTGSYDISATDDDDGGDDDDDDDDGFDERNVLIQKILEKTRKGSPALLNAQKMFFMMDL